MKIRSLAVFGLGAAAALALASQAGAQAAATPAIAAPALTAAAPGVCVLSGDNLVSTSTVGKFVASRLQQLSQQVNAELSAEQTQLQTDAKSLEAQKATLPSAQYQQKGGALQQRATDLQQKAVLRDREMQATEQKSLARIWQEATPLVAQAAQAHSCGVLLDARSVLLGNPAIEITPAVIDKLNVKITQFAFDRERIDPSTLQQGR